jgi:hypothetical protein
MERESGSETRRRQSSWLIIGLVVFVVVGAVLVGIGYVVGRMAGGAQDSPLPTPALSVLPTSGAVVFSTYTPLPMATSLPTATPLAATEPPAPTVMTESAADPKVVAQEDGVNVRSGPGTGYATVGRLEPGAQAKVTGRYGDWWQIDFEGSAGWVANWVVTASDVEDVPEVVPPASPIPPTAAPAPPAAPTEPPAAAGLPLGDSRGIEVVSYSVIGAPGPYGAGADIPFNFTVVNRSDATLVYDALGAWVQDTDIFQKSYSRLNPAFDPPFFVPGFGIDDHTDNVRIPTPGTYNLYLAIHFIDEGNITPVLLAGPVQVIVQ